jgi:hypothetical protein
MADYGRLARALSWWRPANSRRFNRIEDLLGADPDERVSSTGRTLGCIPFGPAGGDPSTGQAIWPVPEAVVEATRNGAESDAVEVKKADPSQVGYRVAPLTQAELERLRPLLSFLVPGQGRSGIVDLGTVVAEEPTGSGWYGVVTDELDASDLGVGPGIRSSGSWARMWRGGASRTLSNGWLDTGDALALDVPPALNINTVPAASRITALYDTDHLGRRARPVALARSAHRRRHHGLRTTTAGHHRLRHRGGRGLRHRARSAGAQPGAAPSPHRGAGGRAGAPGRGRLAHPG